MRPIINAVAGLLERAEIIDPDATVQGMLDGQNVTFTLTVERHPSWTSKWTEVSVPAPEGLRLELSVRPRGVVSDREIRDRLAVDHVFGDATFDSAFLVEGAPEAVVRELMDEQVRAGVLSLGRTIVLANQSSLGLLVPEWIEDLERAAIMIRTAATIGAIAAEIARRNQADVGRLDTSGYRGAIAKSARAREQQEIIQLKRIVAERTKERKRLGLLAKLFIGCVCVALVAAAVLLDR